MPSNKNPSAKMGRIAPRCRNRAATGGARAKPLKKGSPLTDLPAQMPSQAGTFLEILRIRWSYIRRLPSQDAATM
jgi:hypothetical protein